MVYKHHGDILIIFILINLRGWKGFFKKYVNKSLTTNYAEDGQTEFGKIQYLNVLRILGLKRKQKTLSV